MENSHLPTQRISGGPTTGVHPLSSKSVKHSHKENTPFKSTEEKDAVMDHSMLDSKEEPQITYHWLKITLRKSSKQSLKFIYFKKIKFPLLYFTLL